jgi:hypothetical protein
MKKKLNTDSIANELEGASLFFTKSAHPLPALEPEKSVIEKDKNPRSDSPFFEKPGTPPLQVSHEEKQDQKRSNERTFEPPNERLNERSNKRTFKMKRIKTRHTFDIYQDQLTSLLAIQLEKVQAGKKKPKLGKMVSAAIDLYLKEVTKKKRA